MTSSSRCYPFYCVPLYIALEYTFLDRYLTISHSSYRIDINMRLSFFCKFYLRYSLTIYIYIQAQLESHGVEYKQPHIRTHNAQCLCTSSKRYKKSTTILFIYIFAWIELCTWCAVDCLFFVFLAFMQRSQSAISYMCQ